MAVALPVDLFDGAGFEWDVRGDGNIDDGTNDAFDGGYRLSGFSYFSTAEEEEAGRELVIGPDTFGNIEVTRKVFVPADRAFCRFLEIVTNTGTVSESYTVDIHTNLGSDSGTSVVGTSSGDWVFDTTDDWIVTDDGDFGGDPTVVHVISGGSGSATTASTSAPGNDDVDYTYDLTLAPGETQIVMHFGSQNANQATAITRARLLSALRLGALEGMSATEQSQVVNFDIPAPPFTLDLGFTAVEPRGSLIYECPSFREFISSPVETLDYAVNLDAGQTITVQVAPSPGLRPSIEIFDPTSASIAVTTAAVAGADAALQTVPVTSAGNYRIEVSGAGGTTGSYGIKAALNTALEEEPAGATTNDTFATAESIDSSFLPLADSADRGAVMGLVTAGTVLSIDRDGNVLRTVELTSGRTVSQVPLTLSGESIDNAAGLAKDPTTDTLYAWLKLDSNDNGRELVTLDPLTGTATSIADARNSFAALAFDSAGTLYGVTGDNGATHQSLYRIDKTTGVPSFVQAFHTGGYANSDGESLTYDPVAGLLHHISGEDVGVVNSVDPATLPPAHRGLLPSGDDYDDVRCLTHDGVGNRMLLADDDDDLFGVDPSSGAVTAIGGLDHGSKGLAYVGTTLYSLDTSGTVLRTIDPGSASTLTTVGVTYGGGSIDAGNGLATDPTSDVLYGVLSIDDRSAGRRLVTIDPSTGVATGIGNTGHLLAGIAFDSTGQLYGVTGDYAGTPSALFAIDKTTGSTQFIKTLASASGDGEALAFLNSTENSLFHMSGRIEFGVMEAISIGDLPAARHAYLPLASTNTIDRSTRATTYDAAADALLLVDSGERFYSIDTTTGAVTTLGKLDEDTKGLAFVGGDLYSLDRYADEIHHIDAANGATLSTVALTPDFYRGCGLATDPASGTLYAVVGRSYRSERELVTIDPVTGVTTRVGQLNERFSAIAFDGSGNLYGVTGDGGGTASSLFAIDKTNASIQFLESLGSWGGGEALAFNDTDGSLYHFSTEHDESVQIIDPAVLPAGQPYITLDPPPSDYTMAVFASPGGVLFHSDYDGILSILDPLTGQRMPLSTLDHETKGAVFVGAQDSGDTFSFHLQANQPVTICAVGAANVLELYDPGESLVATGAAAANLNQGIDNFVPTVDGTYYARVTGFGEYSLVVTRGAVFDTEPNGESVPQDFHVCQTALGYAVGDGVIVPLGTDGTADPITSFYHYLFDGQGFEWDIRGDGGISDGSADAYDGGLELQGFPYQSSGVAEEAGREVVLGPVTIGDVEVTRKIYVSDTLGFARFLEIVHNPTTSAANFMVELQTNLGSDSSTQLVATSSSDRVFTTDDNWIITDDEDGGDDPTMLHIIANEGAITRPSSVYTNAPGGDDIDFTYDLTLAPGETQIVMHIAAQSGNRSAARAKAEALANGAVGLGVGLTATELSQIVNFGTTGTGDFYTFDVTAGELIGLRTATPAGGSDQFENSLDPKIELYDPSGAMVASDDNSAADGCNAVLMHPAGVSGTYTVRIVGANGTFGEYVLCPGPGVRIVGRVLTVHGTDENDFIAVTKSWQGCWSRFSVSVDFWPDRWRFPDRGIDRVQVSAEGGDDVVILRGWFPGTVDGGAGNDRLFAACGEDTLIGGEGDDTLRSGCGNDVLLGGEGTDDLDGGSGNDLLLGGAGNDVLHSGRGRDILIGGTGADVLSGRRGGDILIGGYTFYDNDLSALKAIRAEWTSRARYARRADRIRSGTGPHLSGQKFEAGVTVLDDGVTDTLSGNAGRDWFFAELGGSPATDDDLADQRPFEFVDLM